MIEPVEDGGVYTVVRSLSECVFGGETYATDDDNRWGTYFYRDHDGEDREYHFAWRKGAGESVAQRFDSQEEARTYATRA